MEGFEFFIFHFSCSSLTCARLLMIFGNLRCYIELKFSTFNVNAWTTKTMKTSIKKMRRSKEGTKNFIFTIRNYIWSLFFLFLCIDIDNVFVFLWCVCVHLYIFIFSFVRLSSSSHLNLCVTRSNGKRLSFKAVQSKAKYKNLKTKM